MPAFVSSTVPAVYEGRIGTDVLAGGHMATFRSLLRTVGGFDERLGPGLNFPAAEDNDLGFRMLETGYRILYVPEASFTIAHGDGKASICGSAGATGSAKAVSMLNT